MNSTYKVSVLWTAWTPQTATRILRDVLALQRIARVQRATLVIASDELLHPKLDAIGVMSSVNLTEPNMTRVYVNQGTFIPDDVAERIPEGSSVEVIPLGVSEHQEQPAAEDGTDPYGGVQFYKSWRRIPDTMPLGQKPPPSNGEPIISPFL